MIKEFITFLEELFPSINPYTAEQARIALRQFELSGKTYQHIFFRPFEFLAQGDVVGEIPFVQYSVDGQQLVYKAKGMLVSNTCSADHDNKIVIAPLIPLNEINDEDKPSITGNKIYRLLYFPDHFFSDYAIDLSMMNSFPTELINRGLQNGFLQKYASLSTLGYFLFLTKLTVHFMRPEDPDVQEQRLERYGTA